jgi:hypothetical protein
MPSLAGVWCAHLAFISLLGNKTCEYPCTQVLLLLQVTLILSWVSLVQSTILEFGVDLVGCTVGVYPT